MQCFGNTFWTPQLWTKVHNNSDYRKFTFWLWAKCCNTKRGWKKCGMSQMFLSRNVMLCLLFSSLQPLSDWSTLNVIEWMATVNMYRYIEVFKRKQIDGTTLGTLTEDRLQVLAPLPALSYLWRDYMVLILKILQKFIDLFTILKFQLFFLHCQS